MTDSLLQETISEAADVLHEKWREGYREANGDKPRWKPLNDSSVEWVAKRTDIPLSALKDEDGKKFVDIAALPNSKLPPQHSGENTAAAEGAVKAILSDPRAGMESIAAIVHQQWVSRNSSWAPAELQVAYEKLPEAEKEKDRVIVRVAAEAIDNHKLVPMVASVLKAPTPPAPTAS